MRIQLAGVTVAIDAKAIVADVDLAVEPGQVVGLIGPNGSGKSTVLRGIYRALRPVAGSIHLGDDDLWTLSPRQSALRTAVVAQETPAEFDFTVEEVVALGRTPHKRLFETESPADRDVVADSLRRTGVDHLSGRIFSTLSGGEERRALLAKAIAQQTRILVLTAPEDVPVARSLA